MKNTLKETATAVKYSEKLFVESLKDFIVSVLLHVENGYSREQIAEKSGLTLEELEKYFPEKD